MTSKLTRERIEWLNYAATGLAANGTEMAMSPQDMIALTECCLAAMDSESDCQHQWRHGGANKLQNQKQCIKCGRVELDAQPAPDGLVKAVAFYEQVKRENPPVETGAWKDAVDWVLKEACRAAMLNGGNS